MTRTKEIIRHYQRSLMDSTTDRKRLLHCVNKLYTLDVTVQHLKETGIGKVVNNYRKENGELGTAVGALIAKWKAMVATEISSSDSEIENNNDDDKTPPSHKNHHHGEKDRKNEENIQKSKGTSPQKDQKSHNENGERQHNKHHSSRQTSSSDRHHRSGGNKPHSKEHHKNVTNTSPVVDSTCHINGNGGSTDDGDGDDEENRLIIDIKVKEAKDNKHQKVDRKDHKSSRNSEREHHKSMERVEHHRSSREKHNDKSSHQHHRKSETKSTDINHTGKRKRKSDEHSPSKSSLNGLSSSSKNKKPKTDTTVDEIDSSMGTSFADALGMMMPTSSKTSKQKSVSKTTTKPTVISKVSMPSSRKESEKKTKDVSTIQPKLLSSSVKLPPLEPVIAVDFPIISNNYKPMPLNPTVMDCVFNNYNQQQPKKLVTDEEAFGSGISSKTMRTKVYSGVKSGAIVQIPSLYQICIRTLQKNIDALEHTGNIPFDILKPVLQLASPQQLFTIEDYNPYLIEDTDALWEFHCKRKFRTLKRWEFETWRDMFLRCTEEQEARLNSLTNNIKKSQTVAIPVKTTKLAYVNSAVKPPRGVIKKQNQYGTERKLVATPAARVAALNDTTVNIAKPGDIRLRVAAGLRDPAQVTSNPLIRPKKAPLMAKTLKSIRSRFKR